MLLKRAERNSDLVGLEASKKLDLKKRITS